MTAAVIEENYIRRIKGIHRLSRHYNRKVTYPHPRRLLELMVEHVAEIKDLHKKKDKHFLVETGDLAVLCFELLLEYNADIDATLLNCFGRYERKLTGLIREAELRKKNKSAKS